MSVGQATTTQIAWIVNTVNRAHQKPVIFTLDGHQRYQLMMADALSASFYHLMPSMAALQINYDPFYANDRNCMKIVMDVLQIDAYIHVGIAHERYQHVNFVQNVGKSLGFPTIYVEHHMPKSGYNLEGMKKALGNSIIVFRSETARNAWGYSDNDEGQVVIPDFISICRRKRDPSNKKWMTIHDHIDSFRSSLWDQVRDTALRREYIELRGWNGCVAYETTESEEGSLFERYSGYVNFDDVDPFPLNLLRAAGYSIPIVSVRTPALEKLFKHGESIIFVDTAEELETVLRGHDSEIDIVSIGNNGQKTIEKNFGRQAFRDNWSQLIKDISYA
jgi:hypothetical protein